MPYYLYCLRRRALLRFFIYSTISAPLVPPTVNIADKAVKQDPEDHQVFQWRGQDSSSDGWRQESQQYQQEADKYIEPEEKENSGRGAAVHFLCGQRRQRSSVDDGIDGSGNFPADVFGILQVVNVQPVHIAERAGDVQAVASVACDADFLLPDCFNLRPAQGGRIAAWVVEVQAIVVNRRLLGGILAGEFAAVATDKQAQQEQGGNDADSTRGRADTFRAAECSGKSASSAPNHSWFRWSHTA